MRLNILVLCLLTSAPAVHGQTVRELPLNVPEPPDQSVPTTRELRVLSPTLAPEQIDRAVLNRLLQEILENPEVIASQFLLNPGQVQDIQAVLSNAHSFINDDDLANVAAMCSTWDQSTLSGADRIEEALSAYSRRAQFTRNFIAQYYSVVLATIEQSLDTDSLSRFDAYMTDRRRRMATAGAVTTGAVSHNVRSGEESIRFHCRTN